MKTTRVHLCGSLASALLICPTMALAGDLTVVVRDQRGVAVADAVVTVRYPGGKPPARYSQPLEMGQKDLMFSPGVLVVPVGSEVKFNNQDKVRHHVYSFSATKRFELKLFGKDQSHSVQFDKPGAVALGCNIHDNMVAFIKVVDTPMASTTDAAGRVVFRDVPPGPAVVQTWQPYLRGPNNEVAATVNIPRAGGVEHDFMAQISASQR